MLYLYLKSLHIIFMVSWFAGLFYLPRLLVYHTEARHQPGAEFLTAAYARNERLLFNAIMVPAMWLTLGLGLWMLYLVPAWLQQGWLHLKLLFVAGVVGFHFYCRKLVLEVGQGRFRYTSLQLRLFNEIATVLLFAIVFLVVLKTSLDWLYGVGGLVVFAVLIMTAVRLVRHFRNTRRRL